jgi:hypothetical protein
VITTVSWLLAFSNFFNACIETPTNWCSNSSSCAVSGIYHIAWKFSINTLYYSVRFFDIVPLVGVAWLFCFFVLPALMGVWSWVIINAFFLSASMLLAGFFNPGEWGAVWCFSSILIFTMMMIKETRGEN